MYQGYFLIFPEKRLIYGSFILGEYTFVESREFRSAQWSIKHETLDFLFLIFRTGNITKIKTIRKNPM
jgi:hypothetical protein